MRPRIAIPVPHSEHDYAQRSLPPYLAAIEMAGGEPVVIALELTNAEIARLATTSDAVLLPGSRADIDPEKYGAQRHAKTAPADAPRDNADELLLQDAFHMRKPLFGICYGLQSLNVWRTGTLVQHLETGINHTPGREVTQAHTVSIERSSRLAGTLGVAGELWVNSSHHQAVDRAGDGLRAVAHSADGTIEALEGTSPAQFVIGVQWHPERTVAADTPSRKLFEEFVAAAGKWRGSARRSSADLGSLRP